VRLSFGLSMSIEQAWLAGRTITRRWCQPVDVYAEVLIIIADAAATDDEARRIARELQRLDHWPGTVRASLIAKLALLPQPKQLALFAA
jgi:hypothetical protein